MKKIFNSKLFSIIALFVVACALFTSCVSNATTTISIANVSAEGSTLTQEQLNAIATLVRNNASARNDFVAAYRGYNVLGADASLTEFPGIKDAEGNYVVNVDAAKAVLEKYDTN